MQTPKGLWVLNSQVLGERWLEGDLQPNIPVSQSGSSVFLERDLRALSNKSPGSVTARGCSFREILWYKGFLALSLIGSQAQGVLGACGQLSLQAAPCCQPSPRWRGLLSTDTVGVCLGGRRWGHQLSFPPGLGQQ